MQAAPSAIFLIHLVQDVAILRPLVFMAARDFGFDALLLVSTRFSARDVYGIWQSELDQICAETGARLEFFNSDWEAHRQLTGRGLLFSASESNLPNHATTHNVFRHAPPGFVKVTLQHGFECVGFRHSAEHVRAHGETASFGADFLCAWFGHEQLTSLAPSQRAKVLVTGPTSVLQLPSDTVARNPGAPGLVCENLHSVRFSGAANLTTEFVDTFAKFSRQMASRKKRIALRPHLGGQYFLKNKVALPPNVEINNAPIYRLDSREFSYAISAPSSVLIDMLLAEIPTAVWRDSRGTIDTDSYKGLTTVSSPRDWIKFARAAEDDPKPFLALQKHFLDRLGMPLQPRDVFFRYAQLFRAAERIEVRSAGSIEDDSNVAALQLSFEKPLASLAGRGEICQFGAEDSDSVRLPRSTST